MSEVMSPALTIIGSGNTPDGVMHLGALREQLAADRIVRELGESKAQHIFVLYDWDGLKSTHGRGTLKKWTGIPLSDIPCPEKCCGSVAEHFSIPYLSAIRQLGLTCKIVRTSELYVQGLFDPYIKMAMSARRTVNKILGRKEDSAPYIPLCPSCNQFLYGAEGESGHCTKCQRDVGITAHGAHGKLRWEIEWAAIWSCFNVTVEPIGPVHTSLKGRSFEKAADISSIVFKRHPPKPLPFATVRVMDVECSFIKEAQCCRRNIDLRFDDWAAVASPELLRYVMFEQDLSTTIDIDIRSFLPEYYRRFSELEKSCLQGTASPTDLSLYELSRIIGSPVTIASHNLKKILALSSKPIFPDENFLSQVFRSHDHEQITGIKKLIDRFRHWITRWRKGKSSPTSFRERLHLLTADERSFIVRGLLEFGASGSYHATITAFSKSEGVPKENIFQLIYWLFFGKPSGPPVKRLLSALSPEKQKQILTIFPDHHE